MRPYATRAITINATLALGAGILALTGTIDMTFLQWVSAVTVGMSITLSPLANR